MSPSNPDKSYEGAEGLDLFDLIFEDCLRIDFVDEHAEEMLHHAVLYRLRDYPDELLVVTSSGGTPGIARLPRPFPLLFVGRRLNLRWQDVHGMGWQITGVIRCFTATGPIGRQLPLPLRQQLGMVSEGTNVVLLADRRRK